MWITFLEKKEQKISNTVIEGEELPYTYKNYIYRGRNWKCSVYNADDEHYGYYYCTLYRGIYSKDWTYKMRSSRWRVIIAIIYIDFILM